METKITKKEIWSWALYDFSNSAYASLIPVLLFPLYYKSIILNNNPNADLWWGLAVGFSILLSGILSVPLGALADVTKKRKLIFVVSSLFAVLGTLFLAFTSQLHPILATLVFIFTNMIYNVAITMYDSLLYNVSSKDTSGKVSSLGWSIGYVGGILCLILIYPFFKAGVSSQFYWMSFIIVALFYLIFSLPAFINVKEQEFTKLSSLKETLTKSIKTNFETFKNWRKYKHLFLFLLAFYFLTEGIATIMFFFALYTSTTLKIELTKIALMLLAAQIIAIPATLLAGKISNVLGYKKVLILTLFGWCLATLAMYFATSSFLIYVFIVLGGLVIGGSQSTARAWYNNIIPDEKRSELFGFNSFSSKISATIGPALFGILSVSLNQRFALLSVLLCFVLSLILFWKIKE